MTGEALWVGIALSAYLLGSLPFGLILTKLVGLGDIRAIGSGNIGATNVLRAGKKGVALATLLLDGSKGAAAVLLTRALNLEDPLPILAGLLAFFGHLYPVWLGGKGGKGVATAFGVWFSIAWPVGVGAGLLWLLTVWVGRRASLASLVAIGISPILAWFLASFDCFLASIVLLFFVFWKHHENIRRLLTGMEPKIGSLGDQEKNKLQ